MPGGAVTTTSHRLQVPLDHGQDGGETVEVFAREVVAADGGDKPYLVYLQGGPGQEAPRPVERPAAPAWLERALQDYRVLLLDQRGTGLSTPYGRPGPDPAADAERLTHFRADAIVRDAECLREHLGCAGWALLGQSFGGFCALHYLSAAPDSLSEVFFTGGLPPVGRPVDEVYAATFRATRMLNEAYLRRYPEDRARLADLLARCDAGEVHGPGGRAGQPAAAAHRRARPGHGRRRRAGPLPARARPDVLGVRARPRRDAAVRRPQPAVRGAARVQLRRRRRHPVVRRAGRARRLPGRLGCCSPPSTSTPGTSRRRPRCGRTARWRRCWPSTTGRGCTTRTCSPRWTCRAPPSSTRTTRTSTGRSPRRPRRWCRRMRPWLTDEYLHNGLRTDGGHVLDRLIGLARGRR